MFTKTQSGISTLLLAALLVGSFLLSACTSAATPTAPPAPTAAALPTALPTALPAKEGPPRLSLVTGSLAASTLSELVAAKPAGNNAPYWEVLPAYTRVTLQGYPITAHSVKPQIFIYPVKELEKVNEGAGKVVAALQALLKSPRDGQGLPFLPLVNSVQAMHAQFKALGFKNGQGVRYLAAFSQGIVPINNAELVYTYQGLTSDGSYYVAAVLPVTHPGLPADGKVTGKEPPEFTGAHPTYLANVVKTLNAHAANSFTPDLSRLDAMLGSLEIK